MTGPFDEQSSEQEVQPKAKRRVAHTFGKPKSEVAREEKEKQIERLLVLIEADYVTFKLQYKVEHPEAVNTLNWVIAYLSELRDLRY
jgi:hypothetical protein